MSEKPTILRAFNDIDRSAFSNNPEPYDKKFEKLKQKQELKEATKKAQTTPKYGSINIRTGDKIDADEPPIYKRMDGGVTEPTEKEKAHYEKLEDKYTEDSNIKEEYIPSDEYREYVKDKDEAEEKRLSEKAEKGFERVYAIAEENSKNGLVADRDWLIKKEQGKKEKQLNQQKGSLFSVAGESHHALTYTSVIPSTPKDSVIINTPDMPNDQVPNNKPRESRKLSPEDLELQKSLNGVIEFWKNKLAGAKPVDLMDFRSRNYKFIKEVLTNTIRKLESQRNLITGTKAKDVNDKFDLNQIIKKREKELELVNEAIMKNIPPPEGEFFSPTEVRLDKELFEKMKSVHEGSIVTIAQSPENLVYKIIKVEDGKVFYKDKNTGKHGVRKLKEVEDILRNPNNRILDVKEKQSEKTVEVKEEPLSEKMKAVFKIDEDMGFTLNPLIIDHYLRVGKEEAQTLFDEYIKLKDKDKKVEPLTINNEVEEKELKEIIIITNKRKAEIEKLKLQVEELKKTLETPEEDKNTFEIKEKDILQEFNDLKFESITITKAANSIGGINNFIERALVHKEISEKDKEVLRKLKSKIQQLRSEDKVKDEKINIDKESKKDMEELTSAQIKTEIEKIIKGDFAKKLEKKGLEFTGLDISNTKTGFYIEANFKGGFIRGNPKFIAEITSVDGKIKIKDYRLEANAIVTALASKDEIEELASNMGENIKKYIEKDKKKEIERIDIVDGVLKITYK